MLHACFTPIALCFVYTSWHFYAFSGTNLLTRCHSASSYFLLFFYSRYLPKEIFSELDETKAKVPIFLTRRWSPKGRRRRARRWPHHAVARAHLWPRHHMVWAPRACTDLTLLPIYCPRHHAMVWAPWVSQCVPRWGIAPGAISIDSPAIFITIADSHDEEGVVLPRGRGLYR
jgi:hypothetical protein